MGVVKEQVFGMKNTKQTGTHTNQALGGLPRKTKLSGILLGALLACGSLHSPVQALAVVPSPGTAGLAWDSSPGGGVAGYRVYVGTTSGNYASSVEAGNATTTTISGLAVGTTYFFAVKAYDASGVESPFSNEISFVPGTATLQLSVSASGQAVLTVKGQAGHTYEVQATRDLSNWSVLGNVTAGSDGLASYTDNTTVAGSKHFYRTRNLLP